MKFSQLTIIVSSAITILLIFSFKEVYLGFDSQRYLWVPAIRSWNKNVTQMTYPNEHCYKNYFERVALIIIYNNPLYDSIPLLKQFYKPIFPHIFICGPIESTKYNVTAADIRRGIFGYECLAEIIRHHHGYKGYMYVNDDVILNYWKLIENNFNLNLIWHSNNQFGVTDLLGTIPQTWYWWVSPYGFNNTRSAVEEIQRMGSKYAVYHKFFSTFTSNGDMRAYNGRSDILYVPQKYAMGFQEISRVFYRHRVFLEIAIPTILRFLTESAKLRTLRGFYIPGDVRKNDSRVIDSRFFWLMYLNKPDIWFIHPFKLHHNQDHNRELNVALLKHILIEKTTRFTQC